MPASTAFEQFVPRLKQLVNEHGNAVRATSRVAYMRGQFPFAGIPAPHLKELTRTALHGLTNPTQTALSSVARELWMMDEREYQYAAITLLVRNIRACDSTSLPMVQELITTKSWWDTVDALASRVVGPLVAASPRLVIEMDSWAQSDNLWLRRTAILHQLTYKARTDTVRLFGYCLTNGGESDFFIRKAIGWALREYSKTDAAAVTAFVAGNSDVLSGLSKREAMLWLHGARKAGSGAAGAKV